MTQEKQSRDEIKWVTEMASALRLELRESPRKQDAPHADVALKISEVGRERRIDVEVVEAIDQRTRAGYNGARRLLVRETTDGLRRRRLNANVGLMFDNGVLGLIEAQPKERRRMAARMRIWLPTRSCVRGLPRRRIGRGTTRNRLATATASVWAWCRCGGSSSCE